MAILPIGKILVKQGLLTDTQLDFALQEQRDSNGQRKLGDILVESGLITEVQFMEAYAAKLMVSFVEVEKVLIPEDTLNVLDEATIKENRIIPVKIDGDSLIVATSNPLDYYLFDRLRLTTGYEIKPVLATEEGLNEAIADAFSEQEQQEMLDSLSTSNFSVDTIAELDSEISELGEKIDSAPVVKLANTLIEDAYRNGVSDIHIEALANSTRVRVRIDGELSEQMTISKSAHSALVTRLKILSDMNIAEKRVPQDGRYSVNINGKQLDLRVSSLPTIEGEKIVIRLLGSSVAKVTQLEDLGMSQFNYDTFMSMLKNPNGVIMVTGPTGSGKTTTLYAALEKVATPNINVVTCEDPVERNMDGINQVNINAKAGLTFAAGLRSILRQDPDVVLIGEIRDGETASIAVKAAITGHLVLSTIHTNDAISTISRLIDMGVEPFLVASALVGVIAQRLVKMCCPKCTRQKLSDAEEMKLLRITEPTMIPELVGCEECDGSGYKGRTAIYEMVPITRDLNRLIATGASEAQLREQAQKDSCVFLRDSVSALVLDQKTDMKQLVKTTYGME